MKWITIPSRAAWRLIMVRMTAWCCRGYMAFAAFTSLFPFLIFLAALAGLLGTRETADEIIEGMFSSCRRRRGTLAPAVHEVMAGRRRAAHLRHPATCGPPPTASRRCAPP